MTRSLPLEADGYAIDTEKRLVHRRHAPDARGLVRARSVSAVYARLHSEEPVPCDECFPAPVPPKPIRRPRRAEPEAPFEDGGDISPAVGAFVESGEAVVPAAEQEPEDARA